MGKHKTPEINSSSTADIAFLLLCFFLMTTTMDEETGLNRRLPPMPEQNQKVEDQKVKKRNVIIVKVNSANKVMAKAGPYFVNNVNLLKDKVKFFLTNPNGESDLPEMEEKVIVGLKHNPVKVSKGVISLQNDRSTSYRAYLEVQNELVKAVNELRNEFSQKEFGTNYSNLTEDEQKAVREAVPQQISEAEPKDVSKK